MARALVVYYSRTGHTRAAARQLAEIAQADIEEIAEARPHVGAVGWLRSIGEAMLGLHPRLLAPAHDARRYELVFLGGPIWMGRLAPAVRAYAAGLDPGIARVAFFCTQNGPPAAGAWNDLERVAARHPVAVHSVHAKAVPDAVRRAELQRFVFSALRAPPAPSVGAPPSVHAAHG